MASDLCTADDVTDRMSGTASDTDRLAALIVDASASVRGWTGQTITQATTTDRLRVQNSRVTLPQRPATAVSAVADVDSNSVAYQWDGLQRIDVPRGNYIEGAFSNYPQERLFVVDVTYTHGYASGHDVLTAVAGIVANIVARAYGSPPEDGAVVSEQIDSYQYRLGSVGAAGSWGLLKDEQKALRRIVGGPRAASSIDTTPLMSLP